MFNREKYSVPNPFGQAPTGAARPSQREGYNQVRDDRGGHDTRMSGSPGYGGNHGEARTSVARPLQSQRGGSRLWQLKAAKSPSEDYTFGNL